jgi:hypothetical protein
MAESRSKRPRTSGLVDGVWPLDSVDYNYSNSSSIPGNYPVVVNNEESLVEANFFSIGSVLSKL